MIRLTLFRSIVCNVAKETAMEGMMLVPLDMYEKSTVNNKVHIIRKLFNLRMK